MAMFSTSTLITTTLRDDSLLYCYDPMCLRNAFRPVYQRAMASWAHASFDIGTKVYGATDLLDRLSEGKGIGSTVCIFGRCAWYSSMEKSRPS